MCEFLERMRLTGTPTEEVRGWSGMAHRVVELTGPFPTPNEMRVELWLHKESATRLLDMCDQIDAEFHKVQTENAKLRELVVRMRPICIGGKRCAFADRIHINNTMEELRLDTVDG
jgi:hypothetical protein